jgi:hypothetical protein
MKNGGNSRLEMMLSQHVCALCDAGPDRMLPFMLAASRKGTGVIARIAMGGLALSCLLMLLLVFVWPALASQFDADRFHQIVAVASLWTFLASMLVLLWEKACRAPRT